MLVLLVDVVGWYTAVRKGERIHRNNIDQFVVLAGFFWLSATCLPGCITR